MENVLPEAKVTLLSGTRNMSLGAGANGRGKGSFHATWWKTNQDE